MPGPLLDRNLWLPGDPIQMLSPLGGWTIASTSVNKPLCVRVGHVQTGTGSHCSESTDSLPLV